MRKACSAFKHIRLWQDADVVFVEYTVNDLHAIRGEVEAALDNPKRRGTERLLRRLLTFRNRPAVVVLHTWAPKVRHRIHLADMFE